MIMSANMRDLGRRRGVWIPLADVEAHLACGWVVVDEPKGDPRVLMAPSARQEERAA